MALNFTMSRALRRSFRRGLRRPLAATLASRTAVTTLKRSFGLIGAWDTINGRHAAMAQGQHRRLGSGSSRQQGSSVVVCRRHFSAGGAVADRDADDDDAVPKVIRPKLQSKYYVPRAQRTSPTDAFEVDPVWKDRLVKIDRPCPTRELNYTPDEWLRHKDPYRRIRHLFSLFSSSPFRRLAFPDLAFTASIGAGLAYYNEIVSPASQILMDGSAMAGATTAIGLLAAFRLNASYGRWDESRKFWGEINNSSRDLAGNAVMWIDDPEQRERMLKLGKAFPFALLFHLNESGGHYRLRRSDPDYHEQKYAEYYAEMHDIFKNEEDQDFVQICNTYYTKGHVPLTISAVMRNIIAHNVADPIYNREMDEQVQRLVGRLGMCERLLRTPIPTCFTRHSSRLFFFWSNLLPFAMYSSLGPVGTIPGSLLVAYAVLGIEDIGVQLEEPFNILPLRQYSDVIHDGINSISGAYDVAHKRLPAVAAASTAAVIGQQPQITAAAAEALATDQTKGQVQQVNGRSHVNGTTNEHVNGRSSAKNGVKKTNGVRLNGKSTKTRTNGMNGVQVPMGNSLPWDAHVETLYQRADRKFSNERR